MQKEDKLHLTHSLFIAKCRELFGKKDSEWKKVFRTLTGFSEATISRYASGEQIIPLTVANLLFALQLLRYYEDDIVESFGLGVEVG